MPKTLAVMGAEVEGPEFAARAVLMGWDVVLPREAEAGLSDALAAARAALPALYDVALPDDGAIRVTGDVSETDATLFLRTDDTGLLVSLAVEGDPFQLRLTGPAWLMPALWCEAAMPAQLAAQLQSLGLTAFRSSDDPNPAAQSAAVLAAAGCDIPAAVAAFRALKARGAGPGALIAAHEAMLAPQAPADLSLPPVCLDRQVPPDWVDYNGHMNEARYLTAFSDATDRMLLWAGMDAACVAEGHSVFTVETHIRHLGEVDIGDRIQVTTRVLEGRGKRLHLWHEMWNGDTLAATGEQLLLHVDLNIRRPAPPRADMEAWFERAEAAIAQLPPPEGLGRFVGAPR